MHLSCHDHGETVSYSVSDSVSSHLRLWLPFRNLLRLCPLGLFPVGRGSNAVQAMFISSTYITSVLGLLYNIWSTFLADLFFMLRGLGWNALRHWGQILRVLGIRFPKKHHALHSTSSKHVALQVSASGLMRLAEKRSHVTIVCYDLLKFFVACQSFI